MGARGLPGRFVPRTRGARDNRGPFPVFSRVIPRLLSSLVLLDAASGREGHEELGLALFGVGLERAFGLPLPLDLGFQLEEGISARVRFGWGRWGRHRRTRLGFAVLSVCCCLLAVQRSRSDWRAVSGYRCDSRPRLVSQTAIYAGSGPTQLIFAQASPSG